MEDNKAIFKGKTGGGRGTNQYQVKGSGKQRQTGANNKTVSCKWLTMKDGRKLCMGSDGNYYSPKSAQGQAQTSNWKATGTLQEANQFANNSYFKGTVYHGTSSKAVGLIQKGGFNMTEGAFGIGAYFADNINAARHYMKEGSPGLVQAKINLKNPLIVSEQLFFSASRKYGNGQPAYIKYLNEIKKSHDGVVVKEVKSLPIGKEVSNYYVAFSKEQIMIIK